MAKRDTVALHLVVNDKTGPRGGDRTPRGDYREGKVLRRILEAIVWIAGGAWLDSQRVERKRLCVIETLPIGVKKQLLLVSCDGERFLVGTGPESVQTIVRVSTGNADERKPGEWV